LPWPASLSLVFVRFLRPPSGQFGFRLMRSRHPFLVLHFGNLGDAHSLSRYRDHHSPLGSAWTTSIPPPPLFALFFLLSLLETLLYGSSSLSFQCLHIFCPRHFLVTSDDSENPYRSLHRGLPRCDSSMLLSPLLETTSLSTCRTPIFSGGNRTR